MKEMTDREFKIPEYEYFQMGGKYSGCKRGMKMDDFSFRITPDDEKINLQIWYDIRCAELSEIVTEADFEQNRTGYLEMCGKIESEYKIWLEKHSVRENNIGYFSENID